MSYNVGDYVQCERINGALADNFLTCPAMEETPAMDAIVGGQSEAGIVQEVVDSRGKVKTVRLIYENRLLESAVTSKSGTRGCTATHETFNNFADYTLDPDVYLEVDETFTIENLNTVCTDDANSMIDKKLSKLHLSLLPLLDLSCRRIRKIWSFCFYAIFWRETELLFYQRQAAAKTAQNFDLYLLQKH